MTFVCARCPYFTASLSALIEHADAEHPCWRGGHDWRRHKVIRMRWYPIEPTCLRCGLREAA